MVTLEGLQEAVARVAREVGSGVVGVGLGWTRGSGVVVDEGKVLTNAHNLRGPEVGISFRDGRRERGRVTGADVDGDVAVVSVATHDVAPIAWNGRPEAAIGTPVFALADPGGTGLRVTFGIVSGTQRTFRGPRGRRITGSLEHTAPLLPGSSGGPVVDVDGNLLGINTNRLGEGFYLAIPADAGLRDRVQSLGRGETPRRPRLGIGIAPAHVARGLRRAVGLPEVDGLLIRSVEDDGPAARAGLQEGDLLVGAGGSPVTDFDDLADAIETLTPDSPLELRVIRGTEERTVTVTVARPTA